MQNLYFLTIWQQFKELKEKTAQLEALLQEQIQKDASKTSMLDTVQNELKALVSSQISMVSDNCNDIRKTVGDQRQDLEASVSQLKQETLSHIAEARNTMEQDAAQQNQSLHQVTMRLDALQEQVGSKLNSSVEDLETKMHDYEQHVNSQFNVVNEELQQSRLAMYQFEQVQQLSHTRHKQLEDALLTMNKNVGFLQQQFLYHEQQALNTANAIHEMKNTLLNNFYTSFEQLQSQLVDRHIQLQDLLVDIRAREALLVAKEQALKERSNEFIGKSVTDLQPTPHFQSLVSPTKPTVLREASPTPSVTPFSLALFSKHEASTPVSPKLRNDHQQFISSTRSPGFQNTTQISTEASANLFVHTPVRKLQFETQQSEPRAALSEPSPLRKFSNQYMSSLYSGYQPASPRASVKSAYWDSKK